MKFYLPIKRGNKQTYSNWLKSHAVNWRVTLTALTNFQYSINLLIYILDPAYILNMWFKDQEIPCNILTLRTEQNLYRMPGTLHRLQTFSFIIGWFNSAQCVFILWKGFREKSLGHCGLTLNNTRRSEAL